jgi:hypothetical protein
LSPGQGVVTFMQDYFDCYMIDIFRHKVYLLDPEIRPQLFQIKAKLCDDTSSPDHHAYKIPRSEPDHFGLKREFWDRSFMGSLRFR